MPRESMVVEFVILHHTGVDDPHYDVMFESEPGGLLHTWRSHVWPVKSPTFLTALADHRRHYLTHEGPVSGDRGHVKRVASGTLNVSKPGPDQFMLQFGDEAHGSLNLVRTTEDDRWLMVPLKM